MNRRAFLSGAAALAFASMAGAGARPRPRIVMLGDSLTAGYGLEPALGLVPRAQAWLDEHGHEAELVNAGLSGDTTYGGRVRVGWELRGQVDAVVVELGGNDLLGNFSLRDIEKNLDSIITQAKVGGRPVLLVGVLPPEGWIRARRQDVQAMWPRVARRHGTLLLPDLYNSLWSIPSENRRDYVQADEVHLSARGVQRVIDQDLGAKLAELIGQITR